MDTIAIGKTSAVPTSLVGQAISEAGLTSVDMSGDGEVQSGIQECRDTFEIETVHYLAESITDTTSNRVTARIHEEIMDGCDPCICRIAARLENETENGQIWLLFAHDWPAGIEVTYLEGSSSDLACYLRMNGGAFRPLHSFRTGRSNLDLDTPLVWKLTRPME